MFLRRLIAVGGAVSLANVLTACAPGAPTPGPTQAAPNVAAPPASTSTATAPKRGGTLKVALDSDIIGIDPHGASAGVDRNVYTSIYSTPPGAISSRIPGWQSRQVAQFS